MCQNIKVSFLLRLLNRETWLSSHLLCFKLILASPVEKDITAPKANNEEKGVDFEGGAMGIRYNALRTAMRTQAAM